MVLEVRSNLCFYCRSALTYIVSFALLVAKSACVADIKLY